MDVKIVFQPNPKFYLFKILPVEPVIDFSKSYFSKNGNGEGKDIDSFHVFAFYTYLTLFNNFYCVELRINIVLIRFSNPF